MARGIWEQFIALLAVPITVLCCCGGANLVRDYFDSLAPKLGTGIGVFVSACGVGFYIVCGTVFTVANREPLRSGRALAAACIAGSLVIGAGLAWLVLTVFPESAAERHGGYLGIVLLLIGVACLPGLALGEYDRLHAEEWAQANAQRQAQERARVAELACDPDNEPDDETPEV